MSVYGESVIVPASRDDSSAQLQSPAKVSGCSYLASSAYSPQHVKRVRVLRGHRCYVRTLKCSDIMVFS